MLEVLISFIMLYIITMVIVGFFVILKKDSKKNEIAIYESLFINNVYSVFAEDPIMVRENLQTLEIVTEYDGIYYDSETRSYEVMITESPEEQSMICTILKNDEELYVWKRKMA